MSRAFRIRPSAVLLDDDTADFQKKMAAYDAFLAERRARIPSYLWRYFREDFFHDGVIVAVTPDVTCRRLQFTIDCPNVKYLHAGDFEFVNVSYEIQLFDVCRWVVMQGSEKLPRNRQGPQFLSAEIDTEEALIVEATQATDDEEHHSLIIEADLFDMIVIFHSICVEPSEPVATELMMRDPRYQFPLAD
jgi:hypothetical protein